MFSVHTADAFALGGQAQARLRRSTLTRGHSPLVSGEQSDICIERSGLTRCVGSDDDHEGTCARIECTHSQGHVAVRFHAVDSGFC